MLGATTVVEILRNAALIGVLLIVAAIVGGLVIWIFGRCDDDW